MTLFTDAERLHLEATFDHLQPCRVCGEWAMLGDSLGPVHVTCAHPMPVVPEVEAEQVPLTDEQLAEDRELRFWAEWNASIPVPDPEDIPLAKGPAPKFRGTR